MSTVIQFPSGRSTAPSLSTVENLIVNLRMVELDIARVQLNQLRTEIQHANALRAMFWIKRILVCGFLLWLLTIFAHADSINRSFYNERGSFAGSSVQRGNGTSFYDSRGSFDGSAIRHGKWTSFYDGRGRYTGSSINTSPRR
jgi:hypothetical protein